jgi:hypothetical protein
MAKGRSVSIEQAERELVQAVNALETYLAAHKPGPYAEYYRLQDSMVKLLHRWAKLKEPNAKKSVG